MNSSYIISPDKITQLSDKSDKDFYFMIPPVLDGLVSIGNSKLYHSTTLSTCQNHDEFYELMNKVNPSAHVIYLPNNDYSSFLQFKKNDLQPKQSVLVFNMTRFPQNWTVIKKYLVVMENTEIDSQIKSAEYFYKCIDKKPELYFQDMNYHTSATFEIDDRCQFNDLYGYVTDQQIEKTIPSGEIAITSDQPFNVVPKPLPLNGELCLHSYPLVLVSGVEPFFREKDQQRLYQHLTSLASNPIIATLKNGIITNLVPANNHADHAGLRVLSSLIEVDERYAILTEIGIGLNTHCPLELNNCGLMEVYGNKNYCVHYGFGNHHTGYHIDLINPNTKMIINDEMLNP